MSTSDTCMAGEGVHERQAARIRRVVALHFDPDQGTPYWLDRASGMGIDVPAEIRSVDDLAVLGEMSPDELASRPMTDFIPRRFHDSLEGFVTGQTGGTTGGGVWTAYRPAEFHEAFVAPFVAAARAVGFPRKSVWLYTGPSGPHIIGKAAVAIARCSGSADPFCVDFDSRWAKKLAEGSLARQRYVEHVVEQALAVIERQRVEVLFTTPVLLSALADAMSVAQRERIRGIHYGGTALSPQALERFQLALFPRAVHFSGYGNTLFGCAPELSARPGRPLDYFPFGDRLILEVVDEAGARLPEGVGGRVRFTRLDESMLLVRVVERDAAAAVPLPAVRPGGFFMPGVRQPDLPVGDTRGIVTGLY